MWRRRERRVVEPFQRATHFADAVKFSPWQENEPSTTSKYNLAPDRMHEVAPHFSFEIDKSALCSHLDCEMESLEVAVVSRAEAIRDFVVLKKWALKDTPSTFDVHHGEAPIPPAHGPTTMAAVLTNNCELRDAQGTPIPPLSVLAEATFELVPEKDDLEFPVKFVSPEDFAGEGLPAETLWYVKLLNADFNAPPESVLEIWLNTRVDGKLQLALHGSAVARLFGQYLSSEIALEVARIVFAEKDQEIESDAGQLAQLTERLSGEDGPSLTELREAAQSEGGARLRPFVQARTHLTSAIATADIRRRR